MNNKKAKIRVSPPIMIGANQYAQDALFLYPDHTARKKIPGNNARLPKKLNTKNVTINESTMRTKAVRL